MMKVVVTIDGQSSSQIVTIDKSTPTYLQAECPSCCPNVSKYWREVSVNKAEVK